MNGDFRLFWCGETVSLVGTATTATLLPLLAVLQLDAGPGWLGAISAVTWAPWLFLGLPAGALVDGWSPRVVMICADVVGALAAVSVPAAGVLHVLTMTHLLVVALAIGTAAVFFRAALPRLIVRVVETPDRELAASRLFASESASSIVGPGLAGLVVRVMVPALGMLVDAVSYMVSALCLARVRETVLETDEPIAEGPVLTRIKQGLAVMRSDPILRYTCAIAPIQNVAFVGLLTLQVLFLVKDLELDAGGVGIVLALGGAGGILGALVGPLLARRFGNARAVVGLQLASTGCLVIPLATAGRGVALMVIGLLLAEAPIVADNVIRSGWRLSYVPSHLQSRVGATIQVLAFASMPLAALLAGWLGDRLGVRSALGILLALHALAALTFPLGPLGRRRTLPTDFSEYHGVAVASAAH